MRAVITVALAVALLWAPRSARADEKPDPQLVERAAARAATTGGGGFDNGTAPWFVDRLCEDIALGADGGFLAKAFDLSIMPPGPGDARENLEQFLDGNLEDARGMIAGGEMRYVGWVVDPAVTEKEGVTWVRARLITEDIRGAGRRSIVTDFRVGLQGGPDWRIVDVVTDGASLRAELARMAADMPNQTAQMVEEMVEKGDTGDAYELAKRLVEEAPDHVETRALFARVLFSTYQLDAAEAEMQKVLAARPDDPGTFALRAQLHLTRGDRVAARADALRAAERGNLTAAKLIEELDITDAARARYEGRRPDLRRGSAAAFVDDLVEQLARGRPIAELSAAFDPELWSLTKRRSVDTVTAVMTAELAPFGDDVRALGWHVSPNERRADGRVHVAIEVPVLTTISPAYRDRLVASLDGDTTGLDDGDLAVRDSIAKLPDAVRASTFERIAGIQVLTIANIDVELAGEAGTWRITDIVHDGQSFRAELPELEAVHQPPPRGVAMTTWLTVAAVVAALGILALIVYYRRRRHT
jgi:hypothetical protein